MERLELGARLCRVSCAGLIVAVGSIVASMVTGNVLIFGIGFPIGIVSMATCVIVEFWKDPFR